MKKIGIIGGTAWPSTVHYYSLLCKEGEERFGAAPRFTIESLDLRHAVSLIGNDDDERSWERFDAYHREALLRVANAGCDVACFAANTPHHRFEEITRGVTIDVVSIIDAIIATAHEHDLRELLLLGTRLTMNSHPIRSAFAQAGVAVESPSAEDQPAVIGLIEGLQTGTARNAREYVNTLAANRPTILGCTELALAFPSQIGTPVISEGDAVYLNSLAIHARAVLGRAAL